MVFVLGTRFFTRVSLIFADESKQSINYFRYYDPLLLFSRVRLCCSVRFLYSMCDDHFRLCSRQSRSGCGLPRRVKFRIVCYMIKPKLNWMPPSHRSLQVGFVVHGTCAAIVVLALYIFHCDHFLPCALILFCSRPVKSLPLCRTPAIDLFQLHIPRA